MMRFVNPRLFLLLVTVMTVALAVARYKEGGRCGVC